MSAWTIVAEPTEPNHGGYVTWRARSGDRMANVELHVSVEPTDALFEADFSFAMTKRAALRAAR